MINFLSGFFAVIGLIITFAVSVDPSSSGSLETFMFLGMFPLMLSILFAKKKLLTVAWLLVFSFSGLI